MLVLRRVLDERIVIEVPPSSERRLIELVVADLRPHEVRLAFDAPRDVAINRSEVLERNGGCDESGV